MWAVTSYYKLYPLTMVVLLINLLLHDLPQTILGMIFTIFAYLRHWIMRPIDDAMWILALERRNECGEKS